MARFTGPQRIAAVHELFPIQHGDRAGTTLCGRSGVFALCLGEFDDMKGNRFAAKEGSLGVSCTRCLAASKKRRARGEA